METNAYDETKNLTSMKKQVFLTSYVELGDLAAQCEDSEDSQDEEAAKIKKEKKEKKALKRKASKHLAPKK